MAAGDFAPTMPTELDLSGAPTEELNSVMQAASGMCDMLGSLGEMAEELVYDVVDAVTGAVEQATMVVSDVINGIKDKLSNLMSGTGGFIAKAKEYMAQLGEWISKIQWGIMEIAAEVQGMITSAIDAIKQAIAPVTEMIASAFGAVKAAMGKLQGMMASAVRAVDVATCGIMSNAISAMPSSSLLASAPPPLGTAVQAHQLKEQGGGIKAVKQFAAQSAGAGNLLAEMSASLDAPFAAFNSEESLSILPNIQSQMDILKPIMTSLQPAEVIA